MEYSPNNDNFILASSFSWLFVHMNLSLIIYYSALDAWIFVFFFFAHRTTECVVNLNPMTIYYFSI